MKKLIFVLLGTALVVSFDFQAFDGAEIEGKPPQSFKAPALVMIGDADIIQTEHAEQFPHSQLAMLPGTDHFSPMRRPDWIVPMVEEFFNAPMSKGPGKGEITK